MHKYYVYILCSQRNGTLYVGVTKDLARRVYEHKNKLILGFTAKYNVDKLVYAETYQYIYDALRREKELKRSYRVDKLKLIERLNPQWKDLYYHLN